MYNIKLILIIVAFYTTDKLNCQNKKIKYNYESIKINNIKNKKELKRIKNIWRKITKNNIDKIFIKNENTIYIRGTNNEINFFKKILKKIDIKRKTVRINIKIFKSRELSSFLFGINYSGIYNRENTIENNNKNFDFIGTGGNLQDIPTPTSPTPSPAGAPPNINNKNLLVNPYFFSINTLSFLAPSVGPFSTIPIVFGGPDLNKKRLSMNINLQDADKNNEICIDEELKLSENSVYKFLKGQSYPFYEQDIEIENQNIVTTTKITFYDIGSFVTLKSKVINKNLLEIFLLSENFEFVAGNLDTNQKGIIKNGILFENYTIQSKTLLKNKEPLFLSMTTEDKKIKNRSSIPKISDIPKFGNLLFATNSNYQDKANVFICITPEIIC